MGCAYARAWRARVVGGGVGAYAAHEPCMQLLLSAQCPLREQLPLTSSTCLPVPCAKQTMRAYVDMLRMEDRLYAHPTYSKVRCACFGMGSPISIRDFCSM